MSLIAFQNCGYLPLILVEQVFPSAMSARLFIAIFLFIQGFNLIFWSYGVQLLRPKESREGVRLAHFLNAPLVALLISFFFILTRLYRFIPAPLLKATEMVGDCTLPVAILTLGGILAQEVSQVFKSDWFLVKAVSGKLLVMPFLAVLLTGWISLPEEMAWLIMIEAAMPSAINLSVVSQYQKSNAGMISRAVFLSHLFGLITIPFFLALFTSLQK